MTTLAAPPPAVPIPDLDGQRPHGQSVLVYVSRHGVGRGQIDISARVIWIFERLGWASGVRWPTPARLARLVPTRSAG